MQIFWIILLVLMVFVVLVCLSGVVVAVSFRNGNLDWYVRYCGMTILPRPQKHPEKHVRKKRREPATDDSRKDFLMDKLWKIIQKIAEKADTAGSAFYAMPNFMRRLFKGISWYAIETDFVIGGTDAAECALLYGKVQTLLHTLLAQSGSIIKVRHKTIAVVCDFTADTCRWDFSCRFRIGVGAMLAAGIGFLWDYLTDSKKAGAETSGMKL